MPIGKKSSLIVISILFVAFSSPAIMFASTATTTSSFGNSLSVLHHFTFSGTSSTTGSVAISSGQFFYYTSNRSNGGGAAGYGQVLDNQSGKDGFSFKLEKLSGANSICPRDSAVFLTGIVTAVRGNGLHLELKSGVAILLGCFSSNSITIASPPCTVSEPTCLIAARIQDTFSGTLRIS
jgi:hypothetical protein